MARASTKCAVNLESNRIRRVDFTQNVRTPHAMAALIRGTTRLMN
jgi:hypothetical protein